MQHPGHQATAAGDNPGDHAPLGAPEQVSLLQLARESVADAVAGRRGSQRDASLMTPCLLAPRACFVTLRRGDNLRGCIGQLTAREPLWQAVIANAARAATSDHRFEPVQPGEVQNLTVEVSVLTLPEPWGEMAPDELLERLEPGRHGVVLEVEGRTSTFLPQVWADLPDKEVFLDRLACKAGAAAGAWRRAGARVSVYTVQHFEDYPVRQDGNASCKAP